jgi:hypothetical protein
VRHGDICTGLNNAPLMASNPTVWTELSVSAILLLPASTRLGFIDQVFSYNLSLYYQVSVISKRQKKIEKKLNKGLEKEQKPI